jgi:AcrR family transcriptional regulator
MARPAKYTVDQILDVTAQLVAESGPARATVATIAERLDAPTGSIYHRFPSRDLLLAKLWIRTAARAQMGFRVALGNPDLDRAAVDAALHIPRWSRANLRDACIMLVYRRQELATEWPDELGGDLERLRRGVDVPLRDFVLRRFGTVTEANLEVASFALLDVPYAAVRRHLLAGLAPPRTVDRLVEKTCRSVLVASDASSRL